MRGARTARRWTTSVVALTTCAVLAGCTSGGGGDGDPTPSASPTDGPATVSLGVYGAPAELAAWRRLATGFEAEHPGVTVDLTTWPDADRAATALARTTRIGTAPDVFLLDADEVPTFVAAKAVQPVDALLEDRGLQFGDDFQRLGLNALSADDALQCMPAEVSPLVVYYNPDLVRLRRLAVDDGDPPTPGSTWTWDQFVAGAQQATLRGAAGVWLPPSEQLLAAVVRSGGGDVVDDEVRPTALTLSGDASVAALQQLLTLVRTPLTSLDPVATGERQAVSRFVDGGLGMVVGTRELVPRLRAATDLRFDVMPLPSLGRTRSVSSVSGLCLSAVTPRVGIGADLIAYAVGRDGSGQLARSGAVVPSNIQTLNSEDFVETGTRPRHADPVFSDGVLRSDPTPSSTLWPAVQDRLDRIVLRLFTDPTLDPTLELPTYLERLDARSESWFTPPRETPSP